MTRSEFEEFLARLVWRTGDTTFEADLQYLIRMGEARLSRDLMVVDRLVRSTETGDADGAFTLPTDCHKIRALSSDLSQPYQYATPAELQRTYALDTEWPPAYTIIDTTVQTTDKQSREYTLDYWATLPDYDDAETWVQTNFFDLYLHACLLHTAPYLREDDRVAEWRSFYTEELESVMSDNATRQYGGAPLRMRMPGIVR